MSLLPRQWWWSCWWAEAGILSREILIARRRRRRRLARRKIETNCVGLNDLGRCLRGVAMEGGGDPPLLTPRFCSRQRGEGRRSKTAYGYLGVVEALRVVMGIIENARQIWFAMHFITEQTRRLSLICIFWESPLIRNSNSDSISEILFKIQTQVHNLTSNWRVIDY